MKQKFKYDSRESYFTNLQSAFISEINISLHFPLSTLASTFHAGFRSICRVGGYGLHYDLTGKFFPRSVLLIRIENIEFTGKRQQCKLDLQSVFSTSFWADPYTQVSSKKKTCSFLITPFSSKQKFKYSCWSI